MTNARQLIAMIRSHAAGDDERFLSVVEEIAHEQEKLGRKKVASDVHRLVENIRDNTQRARTRGGITPLVQPRGELAGLVRATYPELNLKDLVLGADLDRQIRRVVREHRERVSLEKHGLQPRRKFLFSGPPGTGKTMTASVIAGELNLPLFTVLLDGVITKFMGESASKLRLIFDAMKNVRGVYFFDEVDALATSRGSDNDIGEARRMLNSFLQFLEEDKSQSIVIAATNHKTLLDPAIFRRFQASFIYEKPSPEDAKRILVHHLLQFKTEDLDWGTILKELSSLSQADLAAAADDAARDAVLDHEGTMSVNILIQALRDRLSLHERN
ncbi:AAA family ATPase [Sphingobium yanoikuyae]|uniref:AAA family ATPase n=1 Tax=Sphingobium yanoikuyae TaxID=13690 RepID=A0A291N3U8_SPHYA|nr:ATP-binding protein [Sphingobium yanoikuyae]ATI81931.1 AAA family ATPase [Sphingobium yanoikuyae]